ncbi:hypothetical protein AVEN_146989-1 [Araneus ventricosus]|uniref:Uncharacterized protein n=1 Tax=Araneus ventricosus TaxID=182803 RepID=A0A4Y2HR33_ARAVE|nr:hypothetical protein AVEN_146989-1 [Araneus ventricosus]
MEDERIKRKMVETDAESMELREPNSMSSSPCTDMDVITLEYQSQNLLDFPTLERECDRYGISDRTAASIAIAVLQAIGIVHEGETSHVVYRKKIRRKGKKLQNTVVKPTKLTVSRSL